MSPPTRGRTRSQGGGVVDVDVSRDRAAEDAATVVRRAIEATGVVPDPVTTDGAAASPPALAAVLPAARHEPGKPVQQQGERDQQPLTGRFRGRRGVKTRVGARLVWRAHACLRTPRGGFDDLASARALAEPRHGAGVACAWDALTATLLT